MAEEVKTKRAYTEDDIKHLDTIAHIRARPAMYIDGIGELGLYKIDSEGVQNCFDEFLIGAATKCLVTYDSNTGYMKIEDDGRGIPIGKLEQIFTQSGTGGKFDRNSYEISSGQNGFGAKTINALSTKFRVEVWREEYTKEDGTYVNPQHAWVEFEKGRKVNEFVEDIPGSTKHGTILEYYSDSEIFKTSKRNVEKFKDYLNIVSYIDPGIYIEYNVDGKKFVYTHTGGLTEFMRDFVHNKHIKAIINPFQITGSEDLFSFDCIVTYGTADSGDTNIVSYVNGNRTPSHGIHVSAVKAGLSMALTQYIQDTDCVPKNLKSLNLSGSNISNNVVAIVGVRHRDPLFNGQTKEAFKSEEVYEPMKREAKNIFSKWLHNNPNDAKKLVSMVIDYAKYEAERKKLKKNLVDSKQTKSIFDSNSIDPTKYKTCRSKDPTKNELFIVEGQSAGGGISAGRDSNFQALYMLTGKILNVAKTGVKSNLSKVILDLVQISGMGLPVNGKPKYESRAFDKFIILTDADDDGAHIVTLLLAFFYTFYPKIIEEGHVYVANPPLKQLIMQNGQSFFINTEADYDRLMKEYIVNTFEMYASKTKKRLSEGLFRAYIDANNGYNNIMDNHAAALAIDPSLLEMICINISDVSSATNDDNNPANKSFYQKTGFKIHRVPGTDLITFDRGIMHANLKFDELFLNEHFDPIVAKLNEIAICDVYLKGIKSGHEYHGTIYQLNKIMSGILGNKVNIKRYKGLGEMQGDELVESVINPVTRSISKVTMEQAEKAEKAMKIFMTDADIAFKRLFYAGKVEFN